MAALAVANFLLISIIWVITVFISALKYYSGITFTFLFGMALSFFASIALAREYSIEGLLIGFNLGLSFCISSIVAIIFNEYPPFESSPFAFLPYFKKYWEVALGGLIYNIAIWSDKWIMWFSPDSITLPNNMRIYPYYDASMFVAYLTVIPAMAMFLLSQETRFYESYLKFYDGIQNHDNFKRVENNHQELLKDIWDIGKNLIILQAFICIMVLMIAPQIFNLTGMNLIQLSMFRYGVLGASFQIITLFIIIMMSYFDYRKGALATQIVFFVTNTLFTLMSVKLGFSFYGYGYFLSTVVTFVFAAVVAELYIHRLPFHTFVTKNKD